MLFCAARFATLFVVQAAADSDICADLQENIGTKQVTCRNSDGSIDYSFDSFNPKCAESTPLVVVRALRDSDVTQAIVTAKKYAKTFSVRGAGHSYTCNGFKKDSVHVDMRQWKEALQAPDSQGRISLRPGHTMADVIAATGEEYGVAVGSCPSVGVMGYYLHGGSSPRTRYFGNETIEAMQVVLANGTSVTVSRGESELSGLFQAMTQAGSSFGVVTQLHLKLPKLEAPTISFLLPIANEFSTVQPTIVNPDFVKAALSKNYWLGLFQFASLLGPTWYLKVTLNGASSPSQASDLEGVKKVEAATLQRLGDTDSELVENITKYVANHLSNVQISNQAIVDLAELMSLHNIYFDDSASSTLAKGESAELPPSTNVPWPRIGGAGSEGRYVDLGALADQSQALEEFRSQSKATQDFCWYDLGPIKSPTDRVFLDLSCFEGSTITQLRDFAAQDARLQRNHRRYYNLPMAGESSEAYWPNFAELQQLKGIWDPENFFQVGDGIPAPATATTAVTATTSDTATTADTMTTADTATTAATVLV